MDMLTFLPYLLVMAGVTYLIRALPFVPVSYTHLTLPTIA